jgi:hypothetical protein
MRPLPVEKDGKLQYKVINANLGSYPTLHAMNIAIVRQNSKRYCFQNMKIPTKTLKPNLGRMRPFYA